jgi:hypothetical protein
VRNVTEGAKREVEVVTAELEPDLLYPLVRGRDVSRWHVTTSSYTLFPHTPQTLWKAIPEEEMQRRFPRAFAYLHRFEKLLLDRSGYRLLRQGHPFYILSNIHEATFAQWKVVWREVSTDFAPGVIGPIDSKVAIPDHTLVLVGCDEPAEAHYVCGLLASSLYNMAINAYIALHPSPHVLQNVRVPRYDPGKREHQRLATLSQRAHELAPRAYAGDKEAWAALRLVEAEVDRAAAELWGLTEEELQDIVKSLHELRPGRE